MRSTKLIADRTTTKMQEVYTTKYLKTKKQESPEAEYTSSFLLDTRGYLKLCLEYRKIQ